MEDNINKINEAQDAKNYFNNFYNNYINLLKENESLKLKLNKEAEKTKKEIEKNKEIILEKKEYKSKYLDLRAKNNELEIKYNNQNKKLERLYNIIKNIPGTSTEDKMEYMEFAVEGVIPWLKEKSGMKSLKTMKSYFYNNMNVGSREEEVVDKEERDWTLSEFWEMVIVPNRENLERGQLMILMTLSMVVENRKSIVERYKELSEEMFDLKNGGRMIKGDEEIMELHNYYINGEREEREINISPGNKLWKYNMYMINLD